MKQGSERFRPFDRIQKLIRPRETRALAEDESSSELAVEPENPAAVEDTLNQEVPEVVPDQAAADAEAAVVAAVDKISVEEIKAEVQKSAEFLGWPKEKARAFLKALSKVDVKSTIKEQASQFLRDKKDSLAFVAGLGGGIIPKIAAGIGARAWLGAMSFGTTLAIGGTIGAGVEAGLQIYREKYKYQAQDLIAELKSSENPLAKAAVISRLEKLQANAEVRGDEAGFAELGQAIADSKFLVETAIREGELKDKPEAKQAEYLINMRQAAREGTKLTKNKEAQKAMKKYRLKASKQSGAMEAGWGSRVAWSLGRGGLKGTIGAGLGVGLVEAGSAIGEAAGWIGEAKAEAALEASGQKAQALTGEAISNKADSLGSALAEQKAEAARLAVTEKAVAAGAEASKAVATKGIETAVFQADAPSLTETARVVAHDYLVANNQLHLLGEKVGAEKLVYVEDFLVKKFGDQLSDGLSGEQIQTAFDAANKLKDWQLENLMQWVDKIADKKVEFMTERLTEVASPGSTEVINNIQTQAAEAGAKVLEETKKHLLTDLAKQGIINPFTRAAVESGGGEAAEEGGKTFWYAAGVLGAGAVAVAGSLEIARRIIKRTRRELGRQGEPLASVAGESDKGQIQKDKPRWRDKAREIFSRKEKMYLSLEQVQAKSLFALEVTTTDPQRRQKNIDALNEAMDIIAQNMEVTPDQQQELAKWTIEIGGDGYYYDQHKKIYSVPDGRPGKEIARYLSDHLLKDVGIIKNKAPEKQTAEKLAQAAVHPPEETEPSQPTALQRLHEVAPHLARVLNDFPEDTRETSAQSLLDLGAELGDDDLEYFNIVADKQLSGDFGVDPTGIVSVRPEALGAGGLAEFFRKNFAEIKSRQAAEKLAEQQIAMLAQQHHLKLEKGIDGKDFSAALPRIREVLPQINAIKGSQFFLRDKTIQFVGYGAPNFLSRNKIIIIPITDRFPDAEIVNYLQDLIKQSTQRKAKK